jgi:hypothetical protein
MATFVSYSFTLTRGGGWFNTWCVALMLSPSGRRHMTLTLRLVIPSSFGGSVPNG